MLAALAALPALLAGCGKKEGQPAGNGAALLVAPEWTTQTLAGVVISAPFTLARDPAVESQLADGVRESVAGVDYCVGASPDGTLNVTVSRLTYQPQALVSLDGAVAGAMTTAVRQLGEPTPHFDVEAASRGALPTRRARWSGQIEGVPYHVDGIYAQQGQTIWLAQAMGSGDARTSDVQRVIDSARFIGEKSEIRNPKSETNSNDQKAK